MATKYITLTNLATFLGQLKENYKATNDTFGGIKTGYSMGSDPNNRSYGLQLDTDGNAFVEVPWENSAKYTLPTATSSVLGGIKIGYNNGNNVIGSVAINAALILDGDSKAHVYLPPATASDAGLMSYEDKVKLNGIAVGANKYTLPTASSTTLGGIKIDTSITNGKNYAVQLDADGKAFVNVPWTSTTSNAQFVEKKYDELKTLISNNKLVPGTKYRITDYNTVVSPTYGASYADVVSAGKVFDIIVEAISTNKLSENAKVCKSSITNDFNGCNLDAWELKYCIENDTNRFEWANSIDGRGVIYYMKDEWGNEAPYDFKNIKISVGSSHITEPNANSNYFFTFSKVNKISTTTPAISDASLDGTAKFNIIKPSNKHIGGSEKYDNGLLLNRIVCIYDESFYYNQNDEIMIGNYFDYNCYNITLLGSPQYNKFGADCYDIVIGGPNSKNNTFGKKCNAIYLSEIIFSSTNYIQKTEKDDETWEGDQISYNKFGDNCSNITSAINFHNNIFGNNCKWFKVLTNFMNNRIYDNCIGWEFGNYCMKNIIESNNCVEEYFEGDGLINYSPVYINGVYDTYAKLQIYYKANENQYTPELITADWVCNCVFGKNSHAIIKFFTEGFADGTAGGIFTQENLSISSMIKNLYFHDLVDNTINISGDYTPTILVSGSIFEKNYLNSNGVIHVTCDRTSTPPKYGFYVPRYINSFNND